MKNENGVETILAIGITALLLCLGVAYVTTSIVEKKAAMNYQNMVAARVAAQTSFNRAVALMKEASSDPQESFNEIVSHRGDITSWTDADTETLAAKLTTIVNGHTYYSLPGSYPSGYTATDSSAVTWVYLRFNRPDTGGRIIGRIAYVVIPDKGKIDPWAVIDSGVNADSWGIKPPTEYNYEATTSVDSAGNYVTGRPGRDLTELWLASLDDDNPLFTTAFAKKMSVTTATASPPAGGPTSPAGLVDTGSAGDWKDYEQIFTKLGIGNITEDDVNKRNYFKKVFYVNAPEDPEAFWIDISNDSIREPTELYHRFNLARTDWDDITVDSIINSNGTTIANTVSDTDKYYLPWLKNWKDAGGFSDSDIARHQIIANLIDYCDSNTNATTDDANNPTYVGLERCPYINEVRIRVSGKIVAAKSGSDYEYTYTTQNTSTYPTDLTVEVVNMYGTTVQVRPTFELVSVLRWGLPGSMTTLQADTQVDSNMVISGTETDYTSDEYDISNSITSPGIIPYGPKEIGGKIQVQIRNLKIRLEDASSGAFYDYSCIVNNDDATWRDVVTDENGTGTDNGKIIIDYEVADPRQNLLTGDWIVRIGNDSIGNKNSIFPATFTGADTDKESTSYPWNLSTAYIRNAPMKSPWELGFIHRAKAWQTLNLKKYDNSSSNGYGFRRNSGGDAYSSGDANIFDQIKMTSNTVTLGKINVNSDNQSVLRALFDHIHVGSDQDDPGSDGTAISTSKANTLADNVLNVNGSSLGAGTPFLTRAEIVNQVPSLSDDTVMTNQNEDGEQEEIIGKFINLTKAESPVEYTVIAVGEAIKDVGGTRFDRYGKALSTPTDTGIYEPDSDEVLGTQKILAIIKRDFVKNKFYISRIMYLSD